MQWGLKKNFKWNQKEVRGEFYLKFERKATGQASYKPWQLPGEEEWGKDVKSYSCSSSDPRGQKGSALKFSKQLLGRRGSRSEKSSKKLKVQKIMGFGQCLK